MEVLEKDDDEKSIIEISKPSVICVTLSDDEKDDIEEKVEIIKEDQQTNNLSGDVSSVDSIKAINLPEKLSSQEFSSGQVINDESLSKNLVGMYKCLTCNICCEEKEFFQHYYNVHTNKSKVACSSCHLVFTSADLFLEHIKTQKHNQSGQSKCSSKNCSFKTSFKNLYSNHFVKHSQTSCLYNENFTSSYSTLDHLGNKCKKHQYNIVNVVDNSSPFPSPVKEKSSDNIRLSNPLQNVLLKSSESTATTFICNQSNNLITDVSITSSNANSQLISDQTENTINVSQKSDFCLPLSFKTAVNSANELYQVASKHLQLLEISSSRDNLLKNNENAVVTGNSSVTGKLYSIVSKTSKIIEKENNQGISNHSSFNLNNAFNCSTTTKDNRADNNVHNSYELHNNEGNNNDISENSSENSDHSSQLSSGTFELISSDVNLMSFDRLHKSMTTVFDPNTHCAAFVDNNSVKASVKEFNNPSDNKCFSISRSLSSTIVQSVNSGQKTLNNTVNKNVIQENSCLNTSTVNVHFNKANLVDSNQLVPSTNLSSLSDKKEILLYNSFEIVKVENINNCPEDQEKISAKINFKHLDSVSNENQFSQEELKRGISRSSIPVSAEILDKSNRSLNQYIEEVNSTGKCVVGKKQRFANIPKSSSSDKTIDLITTKHSFEDSVNDSQKSKVIQSHLETNSSKFRFPQGEKKNGQILHDAFSITSQEGKFSNNNIVFNKSPKDKTNPSSYLEVPTATVGPAFSKKSVSPTKKKKSDSYSLIEKSLKSHKKYSRRKSDDTTFLEDRVNNEKLARVQTGIHNFTLEGSLKENKGIHKISVLKKTENHKRSSIRSAGKINNKETISDKSDVILSNSNDSNGGLKIPKAITPTAIHDESVLLFPLNSSTSVDNSASLETNFQCTLCLKDFSTISDIVLHLNSQHNTEGLFKCSVCSKHTMTKTEMYLHIETFHYKKTALIFSYCTEKAKEINKNLHKNLVCVFCDYSVSFKDPDSLRQHLNKELGYGSLNCSVCNEKFMFKEEIEQHFKLKHPALILFYEREWNIVLKKWIEYFIEQQLNEENSYDEEDDINTLYENLNSENVFKCPVCYWQTEDSLGAQQHIYWHCCYKPFVCGHCEHSFSDFRLLFNHTNDLHKDKGLNILKSTLDFIEKWTEVIIKCSVSEDSSFNCNINKCSFKAGSMIVLSEHLISHFVEMKFCCKICSLRGNDEGTIQKHLMNEHPPQITKSCTNTAFTPFNLSNMTFDMSKIFESVKSISENKIASVDIVKTCVNSASYDDCRMSRIFICPHCTLRGAASDIQSHLINNHPNLDFSYEQMWLLKNDYQRDICFHCPYCEFEGTLSLFARHIITNHYYRYVCSSCDTLYLSSENLLEHHTYVHSEREMKYLLAFDEEILQNKIKNSFARGYIPNSVTELFMLDITSCDVANLNMAVTELQSCCTANPAEYSS